MPMFSVLSPNRPIPSEPISLEQRRDTEQVALAHLSGSVAVRSLSDPLTLSRFAKHDFHTYEELGDEMFRRFSGHLYDNDYNSFVTNGVRHGFATLTRILYYAPTAYQRYNRHARQKGTLQELETILRHSSQTPEFFARMDGASASFFERGFGIHSDERYMLPWPFLIQDEEGTPRYIPTPTLVEEITTQNTLYGRKVEPYEFCPARGRFMSRLWNAAITQCVNNPNLFQQGLCTGVHRVQ